MGAEKAIVYREGSGRAFWMLGGLYEVLLSGDETNGEMTVMHMTMPAGMGPPPHIHPGSETVYVVEGTLNYHIGGELHEGTAGSLFHIPAGTLENFEPTSTAKVLVTYRPGGIERFFAEAAEPAQRREIPPPPTEPPDVERLVAIAARHGMLIQPPAGPS
jgi:quercetin dioxygenase-like cupin family protein